MGRKKKKSNRPRGRPRIHPILPPPTARDFLDVVIDVGDKVVAVPPNERFFVKAIVTKVTPKMVWIKYRGYDGEIHEIKLFQEQVVAVNI